VLLHPPPLAREFSASYGAISRRSGVAAEEDNHSDISPCLENQSFTGEWLSPKTRIVIAIVIDPLISRDHLRPRDVTAVDHALKYKPLDAELNVLFGEEDPTAVREFTARLATINVADAAISATNDTTRGG
jgi:hypothetical protein